MTREIPEDRNRKLPSTLLRFCNELRKAGLVVSTTSAMDALNGIKLIDIFDRSSFHHTLRATLVKRKADLLTFDRVFDSFWRFASTEGQSALEDLGGSDQLNVKIHDTKGTMSFGVTEEDDSSSARDHDTISTYSPAETIGKRDLSELREDELKEIEHTLRSVALQIASSKSRIMQSNDRGVMDLRKTVRTNIQYGSELLRILRRRKTIRKSRLVVLCDVSGSMKTYSNFAMQYLYALGRTFERIEVFVFGTRLTRITPRLRAEFKSVRQWLSDSVLDWGGGTRIGASLKDLLERYGHFFSRRTIVIVISDGIDAGEIDVLEEQMRRLKQVSRWVIWLNPLLRDPDYQPICRGMQAALPYVDTFTSANTVVELERLAKLLHFELAPVRRY